MQPKRLGPYEIGKPLGKGGMGSVHAAVDTQTGQRVAVKALTPHLAMAEGFRERFEAEIESLKTLRHEGIVRLFGYGEQDGVLFYSMELVEGISLEDELKAGRRFNWREVTNIAIQLSLALKHAHDHGIVHRDIKPANILLHDDEHVKLADFGIARLFGTTQLTTAGGVLGTADYMSPEQADGRPVTARCDQYSLGGVMYALLAGRPPFRAKNLPQMLQLQRFANPEPVRRYAPDTPEQLERVIMQLLAKNPADRFPNTQVLARHLQAMAKALSRPGVDDFSLAGEQPTIDRPEPGYDPSLAIEATQAEVNVSRPPAVIAGASSQVASSQDAATLAADELMRSLPPASASAPAAAATTDAAPPKIPERPAHFTTIEEEETRRQAEHQRSWLVMAAQLAGLAAVLAGMGGLAAYLSRPPSADQLYRTITALADVDDNDASLADVEREVADFLQRYPNDPRATELERYQKRITLDKIERKLQRQARGNGNADPSLLPVELLYLRAVNTSQTPPEEAAAILQSLVDLYGVHAPRDSGTNNHSSSDELREDAESRVAAVVQLAKRRLAAVRADLVRQRDGQLNALRERLQAAERVAKDEPQQAAAMYRAIIDLYPHDAWAGEVVDEARSRLAELESKD